MQRHQRRRARGVHRHRRALQAERVGDPAGGTLAAARSAGSPRAVRRPRRPGAVPWPRRRRTRRSATAQRRGRCPPAPAPPTRSPAAAAAADPSPAPHAARSRTTPRRTRPRPARTRRRGRTRCPRAPGPGRYSPSVPASVGRERRRPVAARGQQVPQRLGRGDPAREAAAHARRSRSGRRRRATAAEPAGAAVAVPPSTRAGRPGGGGRGVVEDQRGGQRQPVAAPQPVAQVHRGQRVETQVLERPPRVDRRGEACPSTAATWDRTRSSTSGPAPRGASPQPRAPARRSDPGARAGAGPRARHASGRSPIRAGPGGGERRREALPSRHRRPARLGRTERTGQGGEGPAPGRTASPAPPQCSATPPSAAMPSRPTGPRPPTWPATPGRPVLRDSASTRVGGAVGRLARVAQHPAMEENSTKASSSRSAVRCRAPRPPCRAARRPAAPASARGQPVVQTPAVCTIRQRRLLRNVAARPTASRSARSQARSDLAPNSASSRQQLLRAGRLGTPAGHQHQALGTGAASQRATCPPSAPVPPAISTVPRGRQPRRRDPAGRVTSRGPEHARGRTATWSSPSGAPASTGHPSPRRSSRPRHVHQAAPALRLLQRHRTAEAPQLSLRRIRQRSPDPTDTAERVTHHTRSRSRIAASACTSAASRCEQRRTLGQRGTTSPAHRTGQCPGDRAGHRRSSVPTARTSRSAARPRQDRGGPRRVGPDQPRHVPDSRPGREGHGLPRDPVPPARQLGLLPLPRCASPTAPAAPRPTARPARRRARPASASASPCSTRSQNRPRPVAPPPTARSRRRRSAARTAGAGRRTSAAPPAAHRSRRTRAAQSTSARRDEHLGHRRQHGLGLGPSLAQRRHRHVRPAGLRQRGQDRVGAELQQAGVTPSGGRVQRRRGSAPGGAPGAPSTPGSPSPLADRAPGDRADTPEASAAGRLDAARDLGELRQHRLHQRRVERMAHPQPRRPAGPAPARPPSPARSRPRPRRPPPTPGR